MLIADAIADLLASLKRRERTKVERARDAYRDLVARVAEGETVHPDQAGDVLDAAGKTPGDLRSDVTNIKERADIRALIAEAAAARPKLRALNERLAKVTAARDEALKRFERESEAIQDEGEPLNSVIATAASLQHRLVETCPDKELLTEHAELLEALVQARKSVTLYRRDVEEIPVAARRLERKLKDEIRRLEHLGDRGGAEWTEKTKLLEDTEAHLRGQWEPRLTRAVAILSTLEIAEQALLKRIQEL